MSDYTEFYCRVRLALSDAGHSSDELDGIMRRYLHRVAAGFAYGTETPEQVALAILRQEENDDE